MGYYTYHSMEVENASADDIQKIVEFMTGLGIIGYALDTDFSSTDCVKWYDEPEQMVEVSLAFPHVHFIVHGEGEDQGDIWDHHYLNGMSQELHAEIVMPEFDPEGWHESQHAKDVRVQSQELPKPEVLLDVASLFT